MGEFETKYLHEVTSMISGFAFKSKHMGVGESRVVKIKNVVEPHVLIDECDVLDETQYPAEKIAKYKLTEGDVLISMTGYLGRVAMMPSIRGTYFLNQRVAKLVPNEARDLAFIKFHLQNDAFKDHCEAFTDSATAQPNISVRSMSQFEIEWPSFENRQAIAEVLSSLDDKINLLKRQNKTLEGMAEALFRQWFIEEAQDDWEDFNASDFVKHVKESEKPQSKPDSWFSHFSLPAFDNGKKPSKEKGEEIKSNKYIVQANSLLVSKLNPGTPRIWHCGSTLPQNPICSTEFQVIKPQKHLLGFFRCLYSSKEVVEFLSACASGTSGSHQRVKPKDIVELEFQAPSEDSMMEFSSLTADWFEKILENQEQMFTLENERNILLPKLMSGEVRVQMD